MVFLNYCLQETRDIIFFLKKFRYLSIIQLIQIIFNPFYKTTNANGKITDVVIPKPIIVSGMPLSEKTS